MLAAFSLSLGQLGDRAIVAVLAKSLLVTLALFALLGVGVWWLTHWLLADWRHDAYIVWAVTLAVSVAALWFLFRAIAVAVLGVFADEVVHAVEARHYPAALASAQAVPFARSLAMGLRSALRFVAVNLLALPLYLVLLATGVGTAVLFFAVNGWLLGRDLGDMVAARHLSRAAMREWRAASRLRRFVLGLAATGLFVVPLVNLVAPVLGAAMATHLFHRRQQGIGRT